MFLNKILNNARISFDVYLMIELFLVFVVTRAISFQECQCISLGVGIWQHRVQLVAAILIFIGFFRFDIATSGAFRAWVNLLTIRIALSLFTSLLRLTLFSLLWVGAGTIALLVITFGSDTVALVTFLQQLRFLPARILHLLWISLQFNIKRINIFNILLKGWFEIFWLWLAFTKLFGLGYYDLLSCLICQFDLVLQLFLTHTISLLFDLLLQ